MSDLAWECAKLGIAFVLVFGTICAGCAYGCYRLGPEDDVEELRRKPRFWKKKETA